MINHFEEGIGLVEGSKKAPINYGHDMGGKAAGWITGLFVDNDGTELWGNIEWTPAARQSLEDGEYRYISPEWNPRDWPWENPQIEGEFVENVFTGAGLTNIPLFTKLKPVMASTDAGNSDKPNEKGGDMDLSEVRVKKLEDLTDEEKAFLTEHKADLTDEERTTFQLVDETDQDDSADDADDNQGDADQGSDDDSDDADQGDGVQASAKGGLNAAELKQLRADAAAGREALQKLARKEAEEFVSASIAKGRIKSDHKGDAVDLLLASAGDQRTRLEKFINNLPENELLAGELGNGEGGEGASVVDRVFAQAKELVDKGEAKTIGDATRAVLKADAGLRKQFTAEQENKQ